MSTHLITGFAGKEHITSADQGSFNAAVMGGGEFVLERGEQFRCQVISNNKVRIYDGDALMQGRHIIIDRNTYEETTHDNGTQGYKRIDLIVLTYEKNDTSGVESVKLEVIKGTPAESDPAVPEYTTGDILNSGSAKNQMPLYQIPFDGLSIGEPVQLFSTVTTLETMKKEADAEMKAQFAELEAGVDEKIADAWKPLASNAADWAMIENYGEYSADAKTVGEQFAQVNESLGLHLLTLTLPETSALEVGKYIRENIEPSLIFEKGYHFKALVNNEEFFTGHIYTDYTDVGGNYWGTIESRLGEICKYQYIGGADSVIPFKTIDKDVLYTNTATYLDTTVTVTTDMTQYDLIVVELYNSTSQYHSFIKSGANWSIGVNMNGGAGTYRVIRINDTSINILVYNTQSNWGSYNVPMRIIGLKNVFKVIND